MILYCTCGPCGRKMNLTNKAATRQLLAQQIGQNFNITCGHCRNISQGTVGIVFAKSSYKYAPVPTVVGGAGVGALFGPLGLIIGLGVGALSGVGIQKTDKTEVDRFNNS